MDYKSLVALKDPVSNQTNVALKITKHLLQQTDLKNTNIVFSPLSLHLLLSMIAAGETSPPSLHQFLSLLNSPSPENLNSLAATLLSSVLSSPSSSSTGPSLHFANGLWTHHSRPLRKYHRKILRESYNATITKIPEGANPEDLVDEINSWVEKETRGLIAGILPPWKKIPKHHVSVSCLYFKAAWERYLFNELETKDGVFHLMGSSRKPSDVIVPFMTSDYDKYITVFDGFKALRLCYEKSEKSKKCRDDRSFSMCLLLPDEINGLPALEARVCNEVGFLENHLSEWESVEVGKFLVPKFKISTRFDAREIMKELGIIREMKGKMYHQAVIEVNERETIAAAVTWSFLLCDDEIPVKKKVDFVADHPFMFLIKEDRSGTVLFMGHVVNPLID